MNLGSLVSETRNPQTMDLDALSTLELVNRFNQQDTLVAQAVKETFTRGGESCRCGGGSPQGRRRLSTWGRAPAGVLGCWMRQNVRPPLGCRTVWSLG